MSSKSNGKRAVKQTSKDKGSLTKITKRMKRGATGKLAVNETIEARRSLIKKTTGTKRLVAADETKRTRVIAWDQFFMGVALMAAQRSKDPVKQVGACIVNPKKRIVGVGYNGMPDRGIVDNDGKFPWGKGSEFDKNKHLYVCHAEMNAIVNKMGADIQDCAVYTTLYPCNECSKLMIQSGIKKVVYLEEKDPDRDIYAASKFLLQMANIKIKKYQPKGNLESMFQALEDL